MLTTNASFCKGVFCSRFITIPPKESSLRRLLPNYVQTNQYNSTSAKYAPAKENHIRKYN